MNETSNTTLDAADMTAAAAPIISVKPVILSTPGRGTDLQVRVSAPATGQGALPLIVFSHGFGWSLEGYPPLSDFWASHGFVVVQPTHLDSRSLNLPPDDPRTPEIWRIRVADLTRVLDDLDAIEAAVPGLAGRIDRDRIAVAGHSYGAQTAGMLLGARVFAAAEAGADATASSVADPGRDLSDPRVKAGVLLSAAGLGGAELTPFAAEHFPFMHPDYSTMKTPALVVAGDHDQSLLSERGPDWFTDAYFRSPGGKSLLTLFGAEHGLGGIVGQGNIETTDENPERVALVQRLTLAYLRSALYPQDAAWAAAREALAQNPEPLGRIESN
jgi:dienelactone hydrolase